MEITIQVAGIDAAYELMFTLNYEANRIENRFPGTAKLLRSQAAQVALQIKSLEEKLKESLRDM